MFRSTMLCVGLSVVLLSAGQSCQSDGLVTLHPGAGGAASSSDSATESSSSPASTSKSVSTAMSATTSAVVTVSVTGGGVMFVPHCNPVTNAGCDVGWACDSSVKAVFKCYEPENDAPLCGACNGNDGPFCMGGLTCGATQTCTKFCCDDGDCGTGVCSKLDAQGDARYGGVDLGICMKKGHDEPACDAPVSPPSQGACITVL